MREYAVACQIVVEGYALRRITVGSDQLSTILLSYARAQIHLQRYFRTDETDSRLDYAGHFYKARIADKSRE